MAQLVQTVLNVLSGSSVPATFTTQPVPGSLLIFQVSVTNAGVDYVPVSDDGLTATYAASSSDFRTLAEFYKVAGADEQTSFSFSITGSSSVSVVAREFNLQGVEFTGVGNTSVLHEPTTTNLVSTSIATSTGSILSSYGFSSQTDAKSWNAGWLGQTDLFGTDRHSSVYKIADASSQTATMSLATLTNNRLSISETEYLLGDDDTTSPLIDSASAAADGASITVNFSEVVNVGIGGSGGFTAPATYGTVTLTPTTILPAASVAFSTSRKIQNGETISGAFAQPGNGFEDAAGNDLASGTFAVANGSKVHRIFSNAAKDTPYTTAGVSVRLLGSIGLTDATATQTLNPDVDGYIQVVEALSTGVYAKVLSSADGTVLGIGNHTVL